jgi:uncharacterized protein YndB with AHSA1/START domain
MNVTRSIVVRRPPEVAFRAFTDEIGEWWPLHDGFSFGGRERAKDIFLEAREGGRLYERFTDGEEYDVGTVTKCEPPRRIAFTWKDPAWDGAIEFEVSFVGESSGTRVEVEIRGWDRAGAAALADREGYGSGLEFILSKFGETLARSD